MQRALVEQAQAGDLDAFTELVKAFAPRLHGVANFILRDTERAQDAVQEALLMGWRHIRALRDPDASEVWMRRLTVRACYGVARKENRRTRIELQVTPDPTLSSTPDTSADLAEREWLHEKLGRLPIEQRVVVVLHYYLDLPVNEVATPSRTVAAASASAMRTWTMSLAPGEAPSTATAPQTTDASTTSST